MAMLLNHDSYVGIATQDRVAGDSHDGEKFLTTRRHPSSFLDGVCVAGPGAGLDVCPFVLASAPVIC